ncbi:variable surface protein [Plasmodium gonderi]|uniref:Variable surface protein n=1 Tax=Plasmodium gonderi TaxID=77519 RepID=A0A1Y1JWA5_PLAGO|nr:variable surface protein [Plasmodium gonderi]GAW84144.1 variable surface protein [Plasmodium gonderi]
MSDNKLESKEFDFTGIFPTCTENFSWGVLDHRSGSTAHHFTELCSDFKNVVTENDSNIGNFVQYCRILGIYLEHIDNNKHKLNPEACCKYFYYRLNKDILDKYKCNCGGTQKCYEKMAEQEKSSKFMTKISNICKDHFVNIDTDALKIMENLGEIYNCINIFKTNRNRTTSNMHLFKRYIEELEKNSYKYKSQLKKELEKIIKKCEDYIREWEADKNFAKHASDLLTHKNWINERKRKLNGEVQKTTNSVVKQIQTSEFNVLVNKTLMSHMKEDVANTGINIGTIFIRFSVLIIIFILYKYTPYLSFLKPRVRKLRRRLNKNNKNNLDFMYLFDVEYKYSADDRYKIAYS